MDEPRVDKTRVPSVFTILFVGLIGCFIGASVVVVVIPGEKWCGLSIWEGIIAWAGSLWGYILGAILGALLNRVRHKSKRKPGTENVTFPVFCLGFFIVCCVGLPAAYFMPWIVLTLGSVGGYW
jgi:hypothetical protein